MSAPTSDPHAASQDGTEVELKLLLDGEGDAERLRAWLDAHAGPGDRRDQVNTYFDTADRRLRAVRAMVRLRTDGHGVRATLKHKPVLRDGLMRVREVEAPLSPELAAAVRSRSPATLLSSRLPFAAEIEAVLGPPPGDVPAWTLHALGSLANTRLRYRVPLAALPGATVPDGRSDATVLFELDHSLGPAGEPRDELEIEDPAVSALRPAIEALLDRLEVAFRPADLSKYAWFLQGLEQGPEWTESGAESDAGG